MPASATSPSTQPPVRAVIRLDHLRHNVNVLRSRAGSADLMAVVKSDAYGHGAARIGEELQQMGIRHFAVARIGEAIDLRRAGIDGTILVLGAPLPDRLPAYAEHAIDVTVPSDAVADAVQATASPDRPLRAHLNVDTGMGRIGLPPSDVEEALRRLQDTPGVTVAGLWTHFATADDPKSTAAQAQLERLTAALDPIDLPDDVPIHAANSSALVTLAASHRRFTPTLVRAGILLYGLADTRAIAEEAGVRPVMQLDAQVTQVKTVPAGTSISYGHSWTADAPTRLATVGAGYGDGYPRLASNRAQAMLRGTTRPLVGTICMDMCFIDCGPPEAPLARAVQPGNRAVLFGPDGPSTFDVADWAETIPYEICCGIASRVPRRYATSFTE